MEDYDCAYICKHLAKSASTTVRVYENGTPLCQYSVWNISPDPVTPYLEELLRQETECGIFTTPLFQFYLFFSVHERYRFVIGPSGLISTDDKKIGELLLILSIPRKKYNTYTHLLRCPPTITLEKSISLLKMLMYSFDGTKPEQDEIFLNEKATEHYSTVAHSNMETSMQLSYAENLQSNVVLTYSFELMLLDMIRNGQVEKLVELNTSQPSYKAGEMARDTLRQMKNESICGATLAARAAIEGGLDCTTALQISDIFIQKAELLQNFNTLRRLQWDLFVDYAQRVRDAHHGFEKQSDVFEECAKFVQRNISQHITVTDLAKKMNLSRAYLCTLFKKETHITLTQYIQKEKVMDAKRLLIHTDHSLLEISNYLAFSSQSHFHTVFKKVTGKTPTQFKEKVL